MKHPGDISVLGAAVAVALVAAPATAAPKPVDSWGRAGVDYETYRNDSLECGLLGYSADVSQTEQAQDFVRATRQLESIDNTNIAAPSTTAASMGSGGSTGGIFPPDVSSAAAAAPGVEQARRYEEVRRSIRPERRLAELKHGMVAVVEDCLRERGYVAFRLTDDQRDALSRLDRGSDERRRFLHGLASSPDVLGAQALRTESS